ncbi:hypothetical protein HK104_000928 [Borealophlyctis nickersoniae]|nr:hypothetical protein HK104_000928 [Borealophlyctis nickersoniae]
MAQAIMDAEASRYSFAGGDDGAGTTGGYQNRWLRAQKMVKIRELIPGAKNVMIIGRIVYSTGTKRFRDKKDNSDRFHQTFWVKDDTGMILVKCWSTSSEQANEYKDVLLNDIVEVSASEVRKTTSELPNRNPFALHTSTSSVEFNISDRDPLAHMIKVAGDDSRTLNEQAFKIPLGAGDDGDVNTTLLADFMEMGENPFAETKVMVCVVKVRSAEVKRKRSFNQDSALLFRSVRVMDDTTEIDLNLDYADLQKQDVENAQDMPGTWDIAMHYRLASPFLVGTPPDLSKITKQATVQEIDSLARSLNRHNPIFCTLIGILLKAEMGDPITGGPKFVPSSDMGEVCFIDIVDYSGTLHSPGVVPEVASKIMALEESAVFERVKIWIKLHWSDTKKIPAIEVIGFEPI